MSIVSKLKNKLLPGAYPMSLIDKINLRLGKKANEYNLFGKTITQTLPNYWFRHSYKELFEEEVYKFNTTKKQPFILDCGAHQGLSVIYFKKVHPDARVICFEPDETIFNVLKSNISSMGLKDVIAENAAVWIENGTLSFESTGTMSGHITDSATPDTKKVKSIRLKDYLEKEEIDFLKIDIEGAEMKVLKDCEHSLNNVKNLFIEYHNDINAFQDLPELLTIIRNAGFRYYIRQAYENMQFPYVQKHGQYMDIQLNIFAFRP